MFCHHLLLWTTVGRKQAASHAEHRAAVPCHLKSHACCDNRWQDYRHPGSQGEQYFLGLEQALKGSGDARYPGAQLQFSEDA